MYNKLFTKILDSSIWLEPSPTRIVWLTLIAVMDEAGFAQFASVKNLAHRAIVSVDEATAAVQCLEQPDLNSSDPDNEGRRIERVPGGWIVLNSQKHRQAITRVVIQEQTRERVRRHRERLKRASNTVSLPVTLPNAVTPSCNTSEAIAIAEARSDTEARTILPVVQEKQEQAQNYLSSADADFERFRLAYPTSRRVGGKTGKKAFKTATAGRNGTHLAAMLAALEQQKHSEQWQTPKLIPLMTKWLNQERWNQVLPEITPFSTEGKTAGNIPALQRFVERHRK